MTPIIVIKNGRREWRPYWKHIGNNNYVAFSVLCGRMILAIPFKDSEVKASAFDGTCWAIEL